MWTQFSWVPSTRECLSIIRVLGEYSLPVVVHLFLNNQLRFPPTQTGSWGRSSSRKQLTKTIRSEGALCERTFLFILLFSHISPMASLVDLPYIGPAIVRDRPLPYYMRYPSEWRNEDDAASHCTRKTQKDIKSILLAIFVKRRKTMALSKKAKRPRLRPHPYPYPTIRDGSTWSNFGARGEHGDVLHWGVLLFSNLGALWFLENRALVLGEQCSISRIITIGVEGSGETDELTRHASIKQMTQKSLEGF